MWPKPKIFQGKHCVLEPLSHDHHDSLFEAVKDGELWNLSYAGVPHPNEMKNEISRRIKLQNDGTMLPFAVISKRTNKAVGMTTFCHTDKNNRRVDIGWTWYAKSHQRTALNTECKLILLTHAFEELSCIAVAFRVDSLNRRSQNAVLRLGAKLEGLIRNYSILPNGIVRDMCFYSLLPASVRA